MKVQTVSKTGAGNSSALVMNTNISPFNVGFGVVVSGSVTYTVQHTFDDVEEEYHQVLLHIVFAQYPLNFNTLL